MADPPASTPSSAGPSRPQRPKVVQPKPTNKDLPPAPVTAPSGSGSGSGSGPSRPAIQNASSTATTAAAGTAANAPRPAGPRIVHGGAGSGSTILVHSRQKDNPVLKHIKSVPWELSSIVPDYQVGTSTCVLFLALRYHRLYPDYIHKRISELSGMYTLRLLLILHDVDATSSQPAIKELSKHCLVNNFTILIAWSSAEAARYLESYKIFEFKGTELIRERMKEGYEEQMKAVLTGIRTVNKTDAVGLMTRFGSLSKISKATPDQLGMLPGFGEVKVKRLREAFVTPFRVGENRTYRERKAARLALEGRGGGTRGGENGEEDEELLREIADGPPGGQATTDPGQEENIDTRLQAARDLTSVTAATPDRSTSISKASNVTAKPPKSTLPTTDAPASAPQGSSSSSSHRPSNLTNEYPGGAGDDEDDDDPIEDDTLAGANSVDVDGKGGDPTRSSFPDENLDDVDLNLDSHDFDDDDFGDDYDGLPDEDELRRLESAASASASGAGTGTGGKQGAQSCVEGDEEDDEVDADGMTREEREELNRAMEMSLS